MIDLTRAMECIKTMQKYGTYRGHKIGRINTPVVNGIDSVISGVPHYNDGQVVIFREELSPSDSEMHMGEYRGMEQKPTGRVTIESPLTQEEIDKMKAKGSLITTIGTMVGVPSRYVEEIRI